MSEKETKKTKQIKKQATKVLSTVSIAILVVQIIAIVAFNAGYKSAEYNAQSRETIKAQAVEEYKTSLKSNQ